MDTRNRVVYFVLMQTNHAAKAQRSNEIIEETVRNKWYIIRQKNKFEKKEAEKI